VETFPFDERYIAGLRNRDPAVVSHFIAYFKMPLWLKARRQLRSQDLAEDAVQETVLRVLRYVRSGKTLDFPERLPAFVHKTCHNVGLEMLNAQGRIVRTQDPGPDPTDPRPDAEIQVITEERKQMVRRILARLAPKDRELLRAMLEEMEPDELCERFGVNRDYLRVLVYRARQRFRAELLRAEGKDWVSGRGAG
jgi:RNA polymerase sigma-70 factor (ECF subfamily)